MTFLLYNEAARHLLDLLDDEGSLPYEEARQTIGTHPQSFKRSTQRMSEWALLQFRAPREAEFDDDRIQVVIELGPRGEGVLETIRDIQGTVRQHEETLGAWSKPLLA